MNRNLYVITPIFNPHQFKSRARLYRTFAKHMEESGAKLFTVEAAFGDHPFEVTVPYHEMHLQLRSNSILWHKERLINLALQRLLQVVPDAKFIGWFDADITFANPDWAAETVHKLMHHPVIQPFGDAVNLDSSEHVMWNCPSTFRAFLESRGYHQHPPIPIPYLKTGHPGLAWAATREALEALGGLYDRCAAGSGDTVMANCFKGAWNMHLPAPCSAGMESSIRAWAAKCDAAIRGNVGYARGTVFHHWHGKSEERGYEKRWSILSFHQFDPKSDLVTGSNGLFRWTGNKPKLEDDIRLSLGSRNEDAI